MPEGFRKFGPYVRRAVALLALAGILSGCIGDEQDAYDQSDQVVVNLQTSITSPPKPPIATPTLALPDNLGSIVTVDGRIFPQDLINVLINRIDPASRETGHKFNIATNFAEAFNGLHGQPDVYGKGLNIFSYASGAQTTIETPHGFLHAPGANGLHSVMAMLTSTEINTELLENHNSASPQFQLEEVFRVLYGKGEAYLYNSHTLTMEEQEIMKRNSFSVNTFDMGDENYMVNLTNPKGELLISFAYTLKDGDAFTYKVEKVFINIPQGSINWDKITEDTQPHLFDNKPKEVAFLDNRGEAASARTLANELNKAFSNGEPLIKAS